MTARHTLTLAPSQVHLLLAILDEARKGQAFAISVYGREGRQQIGEMMTSLHESLVAGEEATRVDAWDSDVRKHSVCPWLTSPTCGRLVIEGRAKVPDEARHALPTEARGMPVEWRLAGGLWHFRIETEGDIGDAWDLLTSAWLGPWPCRFDRVYYEAPAELLADGEQVDGVRIVLNDAGEPTAFALAGFYGAKGEEAADASAAIERVFGDAVKLGPWSPAGSGEGVAEVLRWRGEDSGS